MFSWKHSFEKITSEYETILRKRQALSNLFSSGKISQHTFQLFDKEMEEALTEIEKQKKLLLDKMAVKTKEVEEQIKILERLLANYEIQHVSGEIDEEVYQREIALLSIGLENAKQELNAIRETMDKLAGTSKIKENTAPQQMDEPNTVEENSLGKVEVETVEVKTEVESQISTENVPETPMVEVKNVE
ncbi:MAG: CdvA-like protein [Candidatus Bathyarchaeia archaeon]